MNRQELEAHTNLKTTNEPVYHRAEKETLAKAAFLKVVEAGDKA